MSHPLFLKADEPFIIITLQFLRLVTDQSAQLGVGRPGQQNSQQTLQGRLAAFLRRTLLLLQVVTLLFGEVYKDLGKCIELYFSPDNLLLKCSGFGREVIKTCHDT